ncbi:hypothetical protein [Chitinophaga pinensis]|uniref:Uncharacterized protein n=1 Tax=Chitinophaga pinensis (strain ATCC 43595 / DSM 2588 / LMG 13176 / NBRC 15968 / NCIMB 11800 / UQM 2034) TaxID=485918 RepID=A0A979GUL9_CHIPD|nr:hypothetical protein [Chitinophaga pinensis]ACU60486.1 hypothetical protein Cpin_3010 [Chitinophaga pinensis DSM 2588]
MTIETISRFEGWLTSDIFSPGDRKKMDQKVNGYTAAYIKRKAKSIKKIQQVPHYEALDMAAASVGFSNWKDFVNKYEVEVKRKNKSIDLASPSVSVPGESVKGSSLKIDPYRKLLIAATNELLQRGLITLESKSGSYSHEPKGHVLLDLFGFPSVVLWDDIGFEELRISVWWKYDHSSHPQANLTGNSREKFSMSSPLAARAYYKKFVGVTASAWLERRTGKHLQGKNRDKIFDIYTRNGELAEMEKLPYPYPKGFRAQGKFFF